MVFWIGILVGGLFAWFAIRMGFYETWVMLFNIVISVYLGVFLGPIIANIVAVADAPYSNVLAILAIAIASFLILYGISYIFFTSQFNIPFPKVFDILVAGFLGFLAGFLVWSFVSFLVCITPISQNTFVKEIGFGSQFERTNVPYISWWCNLVNKVVSRQDSEDSTKEAISGLRKSVRKKTPDKTDNQAEQSKPAEPNDVETSTSEENQLGPASKARPPG